MSDSKPLLDVEGLVFRYGDKDVLRGCTFRVEAGERLVIIGSSGSGKSTLLRLILRILAADSGVIRFEGEDLARLDRHALDAARRKMGMVYQGAALISSLTVAENLALPLQESTEKSPAEIAGIVSDKLGLVGLANVKDQLPSELSGGMRKRIGLARALVLEPKLILFDEPSAGLDPVNSSMIDELIISLSEKTGTSGIVVTHNMPSAFRVSTRMAMLHEGRILEESDPESLRRSSNPIVHQFVTGDSKGPLSGAAP